MFTFLWWVLPVALLFSFSASPVLAADTSSAGESRPEVAARQMKKWPIHSDLRLHDPELAAIGRNLIFGQIMPGGSLSDKQKALIALVGLTVGQDWESFREWLDSALANGVATPTEIKETLYQTVPYIGFPRVALALRMVNTALLQRGISLPLPPQSTVDEKTRFTKGLDTQKGIFGPHIDEIHANAPRGQKELIVDYLSAYCFGDFYTRQGLDLKMRELIVFSAIVSLGGCDSQAKSHAAGNIAVGNSKQNLVDALGVLLPINGFPRTLNALAAVNAAVPEK